MTTIKAIKAALAAATPGPWTVYEKTAFTSTTGDVGQTDGCNNCVENAHLIANAPTWLAWCLEQIAARDALLRRFVDEHVVSDICDENRSDMMCDLCAKARKVMEESK